MPGPNQIARPVPLDQGGTGVAATSSANLLSQLGAGSSAGVAAAQATADAAAVKSANLSDLTNAGTARTNLSVPSTAEQTAAIAAALVSFLRIAGSTNCSANPNYPAATKGDAYTVSVSGRIGGGSGPQVTAGDVFYALADNAGGTHASVGTSWGIIEHNIIVGADVQAWSANLDTLAAVTPGATGLALLDDANQAAAQSTLGLVPGTNVQAFHANLTAVSGVVTGIGNAGKAIGIDPSGAIALITIAAGLASLMLPIDTSYQYTPDVASLVSPSGVMSPSWSA